MAEPPIYVDLDDVLCETARGFLGLLRREFDRRVAFEEIRDFDLGVSFGLDEIELERFFERAHDPELLAALVPISESIETLAGWTRAGHEVAVVTGRPTRSREDSRRWLERHRVPHDSLTFVDKYGRAAIDAGDAVPLAALEPRSYRFAVEDSLATAHYLRERLDIPVLLLDRPWNRGSSAGITRCGDWREVRARSVELGAACTALPRQTICRDSVLEG